MNINESGTIVGAKKFAVDMASYIDRYEAKLLLASLQSTCNNEVFFSDKIGLRCNVAVPH